MKIYNRQQVPIFKTPYEAGYNCGLNGADNINSHYKWFLSKISMQDWERGKRSAEEKNSKTKALKQSINNERHLQRRLIRFKKKVY